MLVEDWPLSRIKPYAKNPRKRGKNAVAKVAESIKEFGFRQPIVVDEAGVILVGHTRYDASISLALETAPVHQALGLTEAQKKAYRIADNRTSEENTWDMDLLGPELMELKGLDFELSLTGFDAITQKPQLSGASSLGSLEYKIVVDCSSEAHQAKLLQEFERKKITCRALIS